MAIRSRLRLLLLEDAPADAELALAALGEAGFECEAQVADGREAFERLFRPERYDLVIADYSLPGYTGLDALAQVRRADALLPFILLSGALGEERAVDALRAGATDFVLKGNLVRLASTVSRALEESRVHRQHLATQQALELSERRYRAIVEDQSELIIRMLPDSTATFVNRAYCRYFGMQQDQVLGRSVLDSMTPENREALRANLAHVSPQAPAFERDALVRDAAGAERWMHWSGRGIFDGRGALAEIQSVGRDVTELRRAMDLLATARERLQRLSRRLLEVQEALETTRHTIERVRQLSLNLRPLQLDDLGLAAALRSHLDRQAALGRFAPHFEMQEVPARMPAEVETACFRVAQEAINNIVRHAKAGNVWLRLSVTGERLALSVRDDGAGFDVEAAHRRAASGASLGVVSMEERVALAGGTFQIQSAPGQGTVVVASFPLPTED